MISVAELLKIWNSAAPGTVAKTSEGVLIFCIGKKLTRQFRSVCGGCDIQRCKNESENVQPSNDY
jgi:hypothetical protein